MKKRLISLLALVLCAVVCATGVFAEDMVPAGEDLMVSADYDWERFKGQNVTLYVYNWGLYISDGSDESINVLEGFEELTGIKVHYTTFDTNESMYSKIKSGAASYDLIFPSDYMIGKMIAEDMLAPLDFANIPNFERIGEAYKGLEYDPEDAYSVPYMWGTVGIVYNTTMVEEAPTSWQSLWDIENAGNVLMFNNSRDAFAIAAKKLGVSLNPSSQEDIDIISNELKAQKSVVQAYVMDEIFDKMAGGEAALAPYYAGDALIMMEDNPDLGFVIPEEGTNYFVDAMCIPKNAKNKEAAEMFINYMCEVDVGAANCDYVGYSTPITEVWVQLDDELKYSPIAYPSEEILANTEVFINLPAEINSAMDMAWSDMKSYDEEGSGWTIPVMMVMALGIVVFNVWRKVKRSRRRQEEYGY